MPDIAGEDLLHPLLHTHYPLDSETLPFHTSQNLREPGTELQNLENYPQTQPSRRSGSDHTESKPSLLDDEDDVENATPDSDEDPADPQMKRKARPAKEHESPTRPDLHIETSRERELNGHANGHANGSMNSHMEMRRKHGSLESDSASVKANLMSREDFSLDNEPPPTTPHTPGMSNTSFSKLPRQDRNNFLLLCVLYFLQGIPMGLAAGSVPFLLKPYLSYGQIGIFSLAMYPYSLKLFWSPIVDAVWSPRFGRRKSWITPIQTISGFSMIYLGLHIDEMMKSAGKDDGAGTWSFTGWWFLLVFLCATQDIAVDGWAISLLSIPNISYASTAQSVGLTAGSFLSHTVFLALQAPEFANAWFRKIPQDYGLVSLGGYMQFWGWGYLVVTVGLALLKREEKTKERTGILEVYRSMWQVIKLRHILTLMSIYCIAKLGFVTNESVTNLKLLEKGFGQANLALVVLIDFPFEISLGYYAGKWSTQYTPLRLWCWAFVARLGAAVFGQFSVMIYPVAHDQAVPLWYMLVVIFGHIYTTFMNTIMFVAVSAFHARIADPAIGGTYMTLLATVSNLGGTFPKFFILKLVDTFTSANCVPAADPSSLKLKEGFSPITTPFKCPLEADRTRCVNGGGICFVDRDGYYITNVFFVIVGALLFWGYIERKALALQALPLRSWRLHGEE